MTAPDERATTPATEPTEPDPGAAARSPEPTEPEPDPPAGSPEPAVEPEPATVEPGPTAEGRPPRWRREVRAFAELFALCGFAFAQPLLDIFGKAPDQFIFRGAGRGDIVAFALLVTFAAPVSCWLVELAVGFASARARTILHRAFLFGFAAVLASIVLDGAIPRKAALVAGVAVAGLAVLLYARTRGPRIWLAFASPAPIAFLAVFLLGSQVAPLLRAPAGALGATVGKRTPTVVLVLDEFPLVGLLDADGGIDADLFPNFARLAGTSTWFRQTTAVANYTNLAVPAMLTGDLPEGDKAPTSVEHPENLFTLLGGAMPITSSETITSLCPSSICEQVGRPTGSLRALLGDARRVMTQRLDPADPTPDPFAGFVEEDAAPVANGTTGEEAAQGNARFARFLGELGERPEGLHFLHVLLPHAPHRFLPDGNTYPQLGLDPSHFYDLREGTFLDWWTDDPVPVEVSRVRFLLQLQWVDVLVGRLLDQLDAAGTLDGTNVVVVADHGAGFSPGGLMRIYCPPGGDCPSEDVDDATLAEVMWVPFFVKRAGQRTGEISDDPVRNLDLTPTVADLLDVDLPWDADGRSAYDGGSGDPDEAGMALAESGPRGLRVGSTRTIRRDEGWQLLLDRNTGDFVPADGASGPDRIFRRGPRPDLWGEPLPPEAGAPLEVDLGDYDAGDVDLAGGSVPVLVHAEVTGVAPHRPVAIAVDGTVWATATTFAGGDDTYVLALLPTRAFHDGDNRVTVHALP